jgi:hypothetical protein
MALLVPDLQTQLDLRDGTMLVVSKVTLQSASDTLTVPKPANTSSSASCAGLRDAGNSSATVTQSGNVVTIAGTAGQKLTVVTLHRFVNSGAEA